MVVAEVTAATVHIFCISRGTIHLYLNPFLSFVESDTWNHNRDRDLRCTVLEPLTSQIKDSLNPKGDTTIHFPVVALNFGSFMSTTCVSPRRLLWTDLLKRERMSGGGRRSRFCLRTRVASVSCSQLNVRLMGKSFFARISDFSLKGPINSGSWSRK